jgi:hypothetical protein
MLVVVGGWYGSPSGTVKLDDSMQQSRKSIVTISCILIRRMEPPQPPQATHPNIKGIVDPPCHVFGVDAPAPSYTPGFVRIASLLIQAFITREELDTLGGATAWMFTEYVVKSDKKSTTGATTKMRFTRLWSVEL